MRDDEFETLFQRDKKPPIPPVTEPLKTKTTDKEIIENKTYANDTPAQPKRERPLPKPEKVETKAEIEKRLLEEIDRDFERRSTAPKAPVQPVRETEVPKRRRTSAADFEEEQPMQRPRPTTVKRREPSYANRETAERKAPKKKPVRTSTVIFGVIALLSVVFVIIATVSSVGAKNDLKKAQEAKTAAEKDRPVIMTEDYEGLDAELEALKNKIDAAEGK